jgi:multidrug resistance protein, MATE family
VVEHPAPSESRALFQIALPLALAGLGQMLLDAVGVAVAGRSSTADLAAVGFGSSVFFTVAVFGAGVVLGIEPLVARATGAGDRTRARECLAQGLWLSVALGTLLAVVLGIGALGFAPRVREYLLLRAPAVVPYLAVIATRSFLSAEGRARTVLVSVLVANAVHVVLAPVLVLELALGAGGAGLAATLATVVQLGVLVWFARERPRLVALDREIVAPAFALGLPIGLQMLAEFAVFAIVGALCQRFGTRMLAAHQVAMTLAGITFTISVGIASAGAVCVARAHGRRDFAGARRARIAALIGGGGFMTLAALVFCLVPTELALLLSTDLDVVAAARPLIVVAAAFQLFDGIQVVAQGALRGAGNTRWPLVANLVGHYLVGLPLGIFLAFGLGWGVVGLWWGLCAGLALVACVLLVVSEQHTRTESDARRPLIDDARVAVFGNECRQNALHEELCASPRHAE